MIQRLYIKNFAIIDEIDIDFQPGLTVVTGETGSGKSILLEALGVALGAKADKIMVRNGAERAVVEAKFNDMEIRRIVSDKGRTKSYMDDEFVSLIDLKKENTTRVDFHGQHDQQFILDRNSHVDYLDRYCGHQHEVFELEKVYSDLVYMRSELDRLNKEDHQKRERLDLLNFQANEIDVVAPVVGEDQKVKSAFKKISNLEEILSSLRNIKNEISDSNNSLTEQLNSTYHTLTKIEKHDPNISRISNLISDSIVQLEEAASEINSQLMNLELNPEELNTLEDRLNALESLKRKYGGSIEAVIEKRKRIEEEVAAVNDIERSMVLIDDTIREKEKEFSKRAISIHKKRKIRSKELSNKIVSAMADLNMDGSRFDIILNQEENSEGFVELNGRSYESSSKGIDKVEFYLSANPGEPTKPLASVASGGEISRIMLAIKTVFQDIDPVGTLVFDEIDSGISGKAAEKVSKHLLELAKKKQVICITHLSQIANQADHHLHIKKYVNGKKTFVDMEYLNELESSRTIRELFIGSEAFNA